MADANGHENGYGSSESLSSQEESPRHRTVIRNGGVPENSEGVHTYTPLETDSEASDCTDEDSECNTWHEDDSAESNRLSTMTTSEWNGRPADTLELHGDPFQQRALWTAMQTPDTGSSGLSRVSEPTPEDIKLDQEKKAAIIGAMKNVKLDYIPAWASRISASEFERQVEALAAARRASQPHAR